MTDYKAPSSLKAIEAFQHEGTRRHLLQFGRFLTGSQADGEDLVSDAIDSVCDPEKGRPWVGTATFRTHMRIVMVDLAKARRRSASARREVLSGGLELDENEGRYVRPDDALSDARLAVRLRRLGEKLRDRLRDRLRALQVFEHEYAGVETASELSQLIGCSVDEVYRAKQQIAYHAAVVLAEDEKEEAVKMKELHEGAKKKDWS